MISLIEITVPALGGGYQISRPDLIYITDLQGVVVEPQEYHVVESPTTPPAWYVEEVVEPFVPPPYVPDQVTMRQARLALLDAGLLNTIDAALNSLPEPTKTRSLIEWNHGSVVERNSALVSQMAAVLGLDSTQVDNLFIQASTY